MKTAIITILAGIIVFFCWQFATSVRESVYEIWLMSAVKAPGQMALDSISADIAAGRTQLAEAKLELLRSNWLEFKAESGFMGSGIGNIMVDFSHLSTNQTNGTPNQTNGH